MDAPSLDIRPVVLEGRYVRLEPLVREHLDGIVAAGSYDDIWTWMTVRPEGREGFALWIDAALEAAATGAELPFTTIDRASGEIIGCTRYLNIERASRRLEIGWTWITPRMQRTYVNTEAKYLQLRHCFEELGCLRVELKTDGRNIRSQNAMLRMGARHEGVFRKHQLTQGGINRDTFWFSIIDDEWPDVKQRLEAMLDAPAG